jgi:hypothetical protein
VEDKTDWYHMLPTPKTEVSLTLALYSQSELFCCLISHFVMGKSSPELRMIILCMYDCHPNNDRLERLLDNGGNLNIALITMMFLRLGILKKQCRLVQWYMSVIPTTREAEVTRFVV